MFDQILFELKITFKSIKTWIYIVFVLLYSITLLSEINARDTGLASYKQDAQYEVSLARWSLGSTLSELPRNSKRNIELLDTLIAIESEDIQAYQKIQTNKSIEQYESYEKLYITYKESGYDTSWMEESFKDIDEINQLKNDLGWESNLDNIEVWSMIGQSEFKIQISQAKLNLKYNAALMKSKETVGTTSRVDAMTAIMHYQKEVLPNITWVVVMLLVMDSMTRDFKNGTIKMMITLPYDRKRYLIIKLVSNIISTLVVLCMPILLIFLFLLSKYGLSSANYPMMSNLKGFKTFEPVYPYIHKAVKRGYSSYDLIDYGLGHIVKATILGMSATLSIIPLWKMLLLTLIPYFAYVLFLNFLAIAMSVLIQNRIGFVSGYGSLILASIIVGSQFNGRQGMLLNPMSLSKSFQLVEGTIPYSSLSAIVIFPCYCILLYIIAIKRFRKMDIQVDI